MLRMIGSTGRWRRFTVASTVALLLALVADGVAGAQPADSTEASLRILKRAVTTQRDGSHLSLLFALRQLHDPDLQSLFQQLVQSDQWQIQVHGVLGLGEINSPKHIDALSIEHLLPQAQDAVIATALDLELLSAEQIETVLKSTELQPMARLVLLAELVMLQKPVDSEQLQALTKSDDEHICGLASALLAQLGQTPAVTEFRSRLQSMEPRRRDDLELWLIEAIRRYKLSACLDWINQMLERPGLHADIASHGVLTLLELDRTAGLAVWKKFLGDQPSYQQRVRYCMLLLASGGDAPADVYNRLAPAPDEDLLLKMVALGTALANKSDPTQPFIQLLNLGNIKTSQWALDHLAKLPPATAAPIYAHLIDRAQDEQTPGDVIAHAVRASSKLFEIDPGMVLERLKNAPDDSVKQQAILLGLFESDSQTTGEAAATLNRIGAGRADSLALLLMARHAKTLEKVDVAQLGTIAAGGGRLSDILQVQAAWLYLKHTNQTARVMSELFAQGN